MRKKKEKKKILNGWQAQNACFPKCEMLLKETLKHPWRLYHTDI